MVNDIVGNSKGLLKFADDGARGVAGGEELAVPSPSRLFSIRNALWVPGPKHMLHNITGDILERLKHFANFQQSLKACVATRLSMVDDCSTIVIICLRFAL